MHRGEPTRDLLVPYWLRTVRIGVIVTVLTLVVLAAYPFLPHAQPFHTGAFAAVLIVAAAGAGGVAVLPWRRLFDAGLGVWFLYVWSCADIVLVSFAVGATGGAASEMWIAYILTTVFFGASYPTRAQVSLFLFTVACYVATLAITGWHILAADVFLRLAVLGVLIVLSHFLAAELMRQMGAHHEARSRAERWATLLSAIGAAARNMTLEPERVISVALDSVEALGFEGASFCLVDEDGQSYSVLAARGLPDEYVHGVFPASTGITGHVLQSGSTVVLDDYSTRPESLPVVRSAGFDTVVATPVWVDGWLAAVLIGGVRERVTMESEEVEAFELLAGQCGLALENARRYQEEHLTVERLEELDRMKSDFLATVSHELRTPVTVIRGVGLTLERTWGTVDRDTLSKMLTGLTANAESLDAIITTLLDFSRLEGGRPQATFAAMNVRSLLHGAVERLENIFRDHPLVVDVDEDLLAWGDPVLVDRIVENLLSNAAKHTPPGTTVRLAAWSESGRVAVEVSDDGPGIPEGELPHLTERFFRGGDINSRPRGVGLGLALVSEMLEMQGSELEIESAVGGGSRFGFRLRRAEAQDRADAEAMGGRG